MAYMGKMMKEMIVVASWRLREMMRYDELASKKNVECIAGGATQNSIRVAQWMLQTPGATSFIGCIGKGKFGEEMKKNSKLAGLNVHYYEDEAAPTGTCVVCVVGGESHFLLWRQQHLQICRQHISLIHQL